MSYINYENIKNPIKKYDCEQTLLKSDLDTSLYNPLIEVIGKLNLIGNYIKNNEDSWSSEGSSEGGDTLEFPLSAINGLQTSSTNKILYYNNDGDWEYKDYKELKFPLSELYDLTSDNLDGTKWVLVYDQESSNGRGWKFLPYNTGTGSGLTPGKVAYNLNTINNPNSNVKQILVWDNDGNGTYKWKVENYTSSSSRGLTWNDLINQGNEKIHSSHLPSSWWGRPISNNIVEGNLSGNIQFIKFDSGGHTVYLGLDSEGNLRVSKSENGNDGSSGANFYATGGVSALGNSSSSGGGGTPGETSLKSLLNNVNDLGTSYTTPSTGYTIVYDNESWIDRKLNLSELGDVLINNVSENDVLTYNGTNWINSPAQSVVSSLGQLTDVDDNVSVKQSSSFGTTYPNTILVGEPNNAGIEWKQYVYRITSETTSSHGTQDGGIITALMFGSGNGNVLNYRFPTYITGVTPQNDTSAKYYLTGSKNITNLGNWTADYAETFCSQNVYIKNGELYSGGNHKVLTTDNLNATGLSGKNYAISSSSNGKLYVNVPWTDNDHIYTNGNGLKLDSNTGAFSVKTASGGGLAVDNSGIKISNTDKRVLWGNQDTLLNDIGKEGARRNLQYVGDILMKDEIYMSFDSSTANENEYAMLTLNSQGLHIGMGYNSESGGSSLSNFPIILEQLTYVRNSGNTPSTTGLRIGNAILYWEEDKQALALAKYNDSNPSSPTAANFYATGGVSALGFSNGTSNVDAMTFGNLDVTHEITFNDDDSTSIYYSSGELVIQAANAINLDSRITQLTIDDDTDDVDYNAVTINKIGLDSSDRLCFLINGRTYKVATI